MGLINTQDITVNVTNVNDNAPAFTSEAVLVLLKTKLLLELLPQQMLMVMLLLLQFQDQN